MPKYHVSILNEHFTSDEELDSANMDDALKLALKGALDIASEHVSSGQPFFGALAILTLAPPIARHDTNGLFAVQPRRELLQHARALLFRERARRADVPQQLDARGRRVHVLPARTASAGRARRELVTRNDDTVVDAKALGGFVDHWSVLSAGQETTKRL